MLATADFKVSASGRKVRRLIKVGDDAYNKTDDIDKDGDVDADDAKAKKMRGESVEHIEEATVKSAKYSWGTMKTVHHGKDFSIPLHPEHHKPIAALKHGESHSFKDETGNKWKATREDDTVHFHGGSYGTQKTSVKHDTMKESVNEATSSGNAQHSLSSKEEHDKHAAHMKKTHNVTTKYHGTDEVSYHGDKASVQKALINHYDDEEEAKALHPKVFKESVELEEAADKQDSRLMQLARLGLLDKNDVAIFRNAMQTFKADKQLSIKQRNMLLSVYNDLVNMVTGDDAMFARAKLDVQKEDTDLEEGKRGLWDNIHAKRKRIASGSGEKMRKPGSEGAPTAQDFKDAQESVQIDEISKETLASYIPKAAKDARIHGQIATDFENRGKTARKPGSKDSWNRLSMKYKEKAWKRDDGISKAVNKLTKEETQSEGYYKDIDTNAKEDERLGSWKKETPWRKIKPGSDTVTDKSGATHTPMSKVRHLARLALKKTTSK